MPSRHAHAHTIPFANRLLACRLSGAAGFGAFLLVGWSGVCLAGGGGLADVEALGGSAVLGGGGARGRAGVRALYDKMTRIDVIPTWVKIHDFESRIPLAVEDLARSKFGER